MAAENENQEPSMEEILASIRRIISEDGATVMPAAPPEDSAPLDLMQEVKDDGSVTPAPAPVEESTVPVVELEDITFDPPAAREPEPVAPPPVVVNLDEDALISETTAQASASVLSNLSRLKQPSAAVSSFPLGDTSRTLEGMVLDIIRPQLKEWLDANLPTLVEKIVQKEIQKITRNIG